jgi:hypothetical protein
MRVIEIFRQLTIGPIIHAKSVRVRRTLCLIAGYSCRRVCMGSIFVAWRAGT